MWWDGVSTDGVDIKLTERSISRSCWQRASATLRDRQTVIFKYEPDLNSYLNQTLLAGFTLWDFRLSQAKNQHHKRNLLISLVLALKRWCYIALWERLKYGCGHGSKGSLQQNFDSVSQCDCCCHLRQLSNRQKWCWMAFYSCALMSIHVRVTLQFSLCFNGEIRLHVMP